MSKPFMMILMLLLFSSLVFAYTPTGKKDFSVFVDVGADLSEFVYSTIEINMSAYPGEEFRCITMLFANQNGTYIHVQSNPPHVNPTKLGVFSQNERWQESPEALGYFKVHNGLANVYFRSKDVIAYTDFLYVVKCNSNSSSLIYEEDMSFNYKEFGKSLPSRGAWFARSENADTIVFVGAVIFIILLFIYFRVK